MDLIGCKKRVIPIIVDSDVWKDIGNEKKTLKYQRISLNCLKGFQVLLDFHKNLLESKRKRKRKHDSADGDEAEEIQTEEKRSHGDRKAAEKTENLMKSEKIKSRRRNKQY